MYAEKKIPKYKYATIAGLIISAGIAIFDIRLGIGCAMLFSQGVFIAYLTRKK